MQPNQEQISFEPFGWKIKVADAIHKDDIELKASLDIAGLNITGHFGEACGNQDDYQSQSNHESSKVTLNEGNCYHLRAYVDW